MFIFLLAFIINFMIGFRDYFLINITAEEPDSPLNLSMNLCKGIGLLVIGNLYDNVETPRKLTLATLMCLAIGTLLVNYKLSYAYSKELFNRLTYTNRLWLIFKITSSSYSNWPVSESLSQE